MAEFIRFLIFAIDGAWTMNPWITSQALYQLRHQGNEIGTRELNQLIISWEAKLEPWILELWIKHANHYSIRYIYLCVLAIAGVTAGTNGLTFFEGTHGYSGVMLHRLKKNQNFPPTFFLFHRTRWVLELVCNKRGLTLMDW